MPPIEHSPQSDTEQKRDWWLTFIIYYLLVNEVFAIFHYAIGKLPLPSNYGLVAKIVTYTTVFSYQFLFAFAIGLALSFLGALATRVPDKRNSQTIWMRALAIAIVPAIYIGYTNWWTLRH